MITPSDSTITSHDSIAPQPYYAPQWTQGFPQPEPCDSIDVPSLATLPVIDMPQGNEPGQPLNTPLHDTGTMTMLLVALLLVVASYRTGYKYIDSLWHNIFNVRRQQNVFDDTVNELQILSALTLNTCVMLGLLAYWAIDLLVPSLSASLHSNVFLHTGTLSAIALIFYLLQLIVYNVVAHVFADAAACHLWTAAFKAAHSLLGIALLPVVGLLLVWPEMCQQLLILALILYILCRIAFIFKGFRIFYTNFPSLVYFILYLCSVEIVPLVLLSAGAVVLCTFFGNI